MYYDKQGNRMDVMEWAVLYEDMEYRRVARTMVDGGFISTVWMGLDHSMGAGAPMIFETMVFYENAPFDKIIVTCSPEGVPTALVKQLTEGGRMIVPVGERYRQNLYRFTKQDGKLKSEPLRPTLFVPMTGQAGHYV